MAGVTASLEVSVSGYLEGPTKVGTPNITASAYRTLKFVPGTAAVNQADVMWSDSRTIAASGTDALDMTGSLVNQLGQTIAQGEVVAIYVEAAPANTNNVVIGGAASNPFNGPFATATSKIALGPGEFVLLSSQNGWGVTAGTGDILQIANSGAGTSVTYNIIVIGRTVAA